MTTESLTIGGTNRAGDLRITDTNWNHDGGLRVTVEDLLGTCRVGGTDARAMRRLARRALPYPELTRSSRLIRVWTTSYGTVCGTFAVSRLEAR